MTPLPRRSAVPRAARFERPRTGLLLQLSDTVDVPLIVLAAPAGYGKTTLLAQYARATPRRVAWCRASAQEGPATLSARLASGLPELSALHSPDPRTPPGALAEGLAAGLDALNEGVDLIVDNVDDDPQRAWLADLADRLEEGHRLLLSTYSTAGLRLARRLAEGRALVLDATDLAFSPEESAAYLSERGSAVAAPELAHLGGWPAGLALSAHGVARHASADDLVHDALGTLPPPVRAHLCALAPLEVWTEAGAAALAPELSAGWLQAVQRAGLPVTPLGGGAYRPHRLLTGALNTELGRDPARARGARRAAAEQTEARGDAEQAAALYLDAGAPAEALRLAQTLVPLYRDRGEHRLTRALLERFAPDQLNPALRERLAWAQIETGAAPSGEATLEALRGAGALSASGLASLAMVRGRQGDTAAQYELARQGLALGGPPVPALFWPFVQAALRLGHSAQAEQAAEDFWAWARAGADPVRQAEAWQLRALVWRRTRPAQEAAQALAQARAAYEALGWQGRAAAVHLDELDLSVQGGAASEVLAVTLGALEGRLPAGAAVAQVRRLRLLGTVQGRLGQKDSAEATLRRALQAAQEAGIDPQGSGLTGALAEVLRDAARPAPAPQVPAPAADPAPYRLSLTTLGDCRAAVNGQPVKLGLAKARELLVWLALHGSGSRDELVTALWDGSAEERHIEYFRVTVRRLRAALREHLPAGLDPLPYADGRYRLDGALTVMLDLQAPPDLGALKPFLPGVDSEWVAHYRQAQAQRAVAALLAQAAASAPPQAAQTCRALLGADPLLCPAHEGLILALQAQSDDAAVRQALHTYARVLREEYGEGLPPAFQALLPQAAR
ncbi:hypothetical protein [Deinococcus arcticus]|uniref:MalT-like winged helix domain-containing protein n=1 Tax=Deinococcus arcticus TaxID=2136176 RepID=A0A2T3W6M0_9DEIO|nr:hypothetical protein [Deinococcus arcticus]PTA67545.1 hypothetical protein C8263_11950 [Deinococcus arcticus]